ncbi:right-handed parallel beta-helix repeat-containing protein [Leucobacter tenebrionis]|uniref:right-handed parallel beta-helix repeat-containing protein n=1 Tax=Leucobacter tenebrionis TaxID=2873270 RepID=UPI001CA74B70|nr:right-handed parallel beta-helix repeat-containing protein [Leucobacter tenebrionis]QZY53064.1 right-handed parallel beta-helix repeat-containing protein [Leucobacter tenebrionis]
MTNQFFDREPVTEPSAEAGAVSRAAGTGDSVDAADDQAVTFATPTPELDSAVAQLLSDDSSQTYDAGGRSFYLSVGVAAAGTADNRTALVAGASRAEALGQHIALLPGVHRVASNLTISQPVLMHPGAVIRPDNGVAVTLAGGLSSPVGMCFDQSQGGVVRPERVDWHPYWWGPVGTNDDSSTWREMVRAQMSVSSDEDRKITVIAPLGVNRIAGVYLESTHLSASSSIFKPPVGHTGNHGYMVRMGPWTVIDDGTWHSDGLHNFRVFQQEGPRCAIRGAAVICLGNRETYGLYVVNTPGASVTPKVMNCRFYGGDGTGVAIRLGSPDAELTNIWIGLNEIGILDEGGAATLINCHVWGCSQCGVSLRSGSKLSASYIETNPVWGLILRESLGVAVEGTRFWLNGTTGNTESGGVLITQTRANGTTAAGGDNIITGCVFDDSYETAVTIVNARSNQIVNSNFTSRRFLNGTQPAARSAVRIDEASRDNVVEIHAVKQFFTGDVVVDESQSNTVTAGRIEAAKFDGMSIGTGGFTPYLVRRSIGIGQYTFRGHAFITSTQQVNLRLNQENVSAGYWGASDVGGVARPLRHAGGGFQSIPSTGGEARRVEFSGYADVSSRGSFTLSVSAEGTGTAQIHFASIEFTKYL